MANSKPAPHGAFKPLPIARSVGRIDRQFSVDALADVGRKLEPLTGRGGVKETTFIYIIAHSPEYRGKRYIAISDNVLVENEDDYLPRASMGVGSQAGTHQSSIL